MKTIKLSLLATIIAVFISACSKGPVEEPKEPENPIDPIAKCEHKGKFERVICGSGFYNDYWIRLENGILLQPCDVQVKTIPVNEVYEGMPITVSYTLVNDCKQYWDRIICQAVPPAHEIAQITCLEKIGEEEPAKCEKTGKFVKTICGSGLYGNYWIRLDDGTLLQPCQSDADLVDASLLYDGMPVAVSYSQILTTDAQCPTILGCKAYPGAHITVNITCLTPKMKRCPDEPTDKCTHLGVLRDKRNKLDGCSWLVELNTGEVLDVGMQIDENQFKDGTPVMVGYNEIVNVWNPCMAGTPVELTCIRVANTNN